MRGEWRLRGGYQVARATRGRPNSVGSGLKQGCNTVRKFDRRRCHFDGYQRYIEYLALL